MTDLKVRPIRSILRRIVPAALVAGLLFGLAGTPAARLFVSTAAAQTGTRSGVLAVAGADGATLYESPVGSPVGTLPVGTTLTAVSRSADSQWVAVVLDSGESAWVPVGEVVLFGLSGLPVAGEEGAGSVPTEPAAAASRATSTPLPPTPTPTPVPPTPTPVPPTPTRPPATPTTRATAASVQGSVLAVVGANSASLSAEPEGELVERLLTGAAVSVTGRSENGDWLAVTTTDGTPGWVQTSELVVFNIGKIPIVGAEPDRPEPAAGETTPLAAAAPLTLTAALSETPTTTVEAAAPITATTAAEPSPTRPAATATLRPTPVLQEGDISATVVLTGTRLNVRSGPGTDFAIVAKANPGERFLVTGRNGPATWVKIELSDGKSGWVAVEFVRLSDPVVNLPIVLEEESAGTGEEEESDTPVPTPTPQLPRSSELSGTLVFQNGQGKIYLYDLAAGSVRFLADGYEPEISRDGRKVTFTRYGGEGGIYAIDADGQNERRLFGEREIISSPKWSPDGQWITFSRSAGEYECTNLGFGICINLPSCPNDEDLPEGVSFDCPLDSIGTTVAQPQFALARIDANGDNYRDLNSLTTARAPDWNEVGIAYAASTGIEVTDDTPDARTARLVEGRYYEDPDWQPGGGRVVFQSREGGHWEIFGVNSDGRGLAALTKPVTTLVDQLPSNVAPAWSPNGQHIVYLSNRDDRNDAGPWRIWVMNADGSNQRPLPIDVPLTYGFAQEQMVGWGGADE